MGFSNMIKMFDLYQTKVTLTFDGKSSFKTLFGALISIVIMLSVLSIFGLLVYWIIIKIMTSTSINKIFKDYTNDSEMHYFAKSDVYFAFV